MINLTINGKAVQADAGETILAVARREGFVIPTLCYHETVGSSGLCKMCVVEVQEEDKKRVAASCIIKVKEGMAVSTDTEEVREARKASLAGMLARSYSEGVARLAEEYGVAIPAEKNSNKCITCNLCVKTCKNVVGIGAVEMTGKGEERKVGLKANGPESSCIACGACFVTCPTGHIVMEDDKDTRTIWGKQFKLAACSKCGRYHAPVSQLEWISGKTGVSMDKLMLCTECK